MKALLAKLTGPHPTLTDTALLALRLWFGLVMLVAHGWGKWGNLDKFAAGLAEQGYPIPDVMAVLAAASESIGGLFVALGLLTRPAALTMVVTMLVAAFVAHPGEWKKQELPLTYAAIAFGLMLAGAGRFSLDHLIAKRLRSNE